MKRAGVLVEGIDRGVTVARARERGETHQPDDELVPAQPWRRVRELRRFGAERGARDVVEEIGMGRLHRLGERAELELKRCRHVRAIVTGAARESEGKRDGEDRPHLDG